MGHRHLGGCGYRLAGGWSRKLSLLCWGRGEDGGEQDAAGKPEGAALDSLQINSLPPKLAEDWVHRDLLT